ncbi:hypothetical protein [Otoolea muris]|nr:hypothetical protein [Otoolea muris]
MSYPTEVLCKLRMAEEKWKEAEEELADAAALSGLKELCFCR